MNLSFRSDIVKITEKDFLNYIKCPLYYKLESNGQNLQKDTYNKFLHYVADQYLNRLANVNLLGPFNQEKYIKKKFKGVRIGFFLPDS